MSRSNEYEYPPKPSNLPELDPVSERLISPRIPYMQIRRLRRDDAYGIVGQIINVPVEVDTMVRSLPRSLEVDYAFNVHLKKHMVHKSSYLSGYVVKSKLDTWLRFLVQQPLYKHYNIKVDFSVFRSSDHDDSPQESVAENIEGIDANAATDSELILANRQTMLWSEEKSLTIAPGQNRRPESLLFDQYAEELSFPSIYLGVPRTIRSRGGHLPRSTPYTWCMSEIRRKDRRGATPTHVLYQAMKMLRLRLRGGIQNMFRCVRPTEDITREQIEDREFVGRMLESNQCFLRSIPNSMEYWDSRKKDLFAIIRQLDTPHAFLTISANETRWPKLLRTLHRLSDKYKNVDSNVSLNEVLDKFDGFQRAHLVAEDPVVCAAYFYRLVHEHQEELITHSADTVLWIISYVSNFSIEEALMHPYYFG